MTISKNTQALLNIITNWGDGNQIYNLYNFRDMELHGSFEECEIVEEWFDEDFREKGNDFIEFGYNKSGDPFALWIHPDLKGEPPVVLLDSDGEVELLAPSLGDFLSLLTDEDCIVGNREEEEVLWYAIYKHQFKEIVEENANFNNVEEVIAQFKKEMEELRTQITKIHKCKDVSDIISDIQNLPDFKEWFEENFAL